MLKKIKNFFLTLVKINEINLSKSKIIFYSEDKNYQKFSYPLIEYFSQKFPNEIYYVSSDLNDFINNLKVKNVYLESNFLLRYFFTLVKTDNLFMTLTDLDNSIIKRNKFVKNYVYYFHGAVSTTKIYTNSAFDNYDTILCNGEYQIREIRQREYLNNLKKKKLIRSGFFYFDFLKKKTNTLINDKTEILVAPSWNINKTNFINEDFEKIIKILLKAGFIVRFRPHPETIKRSYKLMLRYKEMFHGKNFIYDDDPSNITALNNSKCLITDNSGIAIECSLIFRKPVIYYENFEKIHNTQFNSYKNLVPMEDLVKEKFGFLFNKNQIENISNIVNNCAYTLDEKIIDNFLNNNFYNQNQTIKYLDKKLNEILI